MSEEIAYLSASEALQQFAAKKLSPVELLQALITRIERINGPINSFSDTYFDEAMAKAKAAEKAWKTPGKARPLEGIPLAVKDAQRVAGKRTTQGSLIFKDHVDDHSDPMIERLEAAGAIIFARTTVPEFCLSGVCRTRLFGNTVNPWNFDYGPGGSSGGSGAALAAGMTTLATGTDIGGSIRIPAAACGVVGYKPPKGRNPDGAPANFDRYNHCGPLTRTVADAALMQNVTSGPHPLDHDSLSEVVRIPQSLPDIKGWRIAFSLDLGYMPVDPEVRANTLAALEVFRSLGATVEEVDLGWTPEVDAACMHWYNAMNFGRQTIWQKAKHPELMTDYALAFAEAAERLTGINDVHRPWEMAHKMYQTLGPVLARSQLFVCPTLTVPAIRADHDPFDRQYKVAGRVVDAEYGWVMTHQFNMLHNLPVMSVPSGHAKSRVPTAIQLIAQPQNDLAVFQAAMAYEKACGGWYGDTTKRPSL